MTMENLNITRQTQYFLKKKKARVKSCYLTLFNEVTELYQIGAERVSLTCLY